jgi:hypothetical protein
MRTRLDCLDLILLPTSDVDPTRTVSWGRVRTLYR